MNQLAKKFVRKNNKGFTLLEILMVLALLGIIFSILGGKIISSFSRGKVNATKIQIQKIGSDLDQYKFDCNRYPTTGQGLKALVSAPSEAPACPNYNPDGYNGGKKKVPVDAWSNEFAYTSDGSTYVLKSLGADGLEGGEKENKDLSSADE